MEKLHFGVAGEHKPTHTFNAGHSEGKALEYMMQI